jgi:hypothetical protein
MKWLRPTLAAIVGVIAVVGLLCVAIGFWAQNTVFDESKVAAAATVALDEPEVTDALAVRLANDVVAAVDLESLVNSVLPPALQRLTPAIVGGAIQIVERELAQLLSNPDVRERLTVVFERAYAAFLDVLQGDGLVDGVTVNDGAVTVNFLPVIARGVTALQRLGFASDVTVPELTREGEPSQQIAELEQAFSRDLPDDFGQVVVYRSDSLAEKGQTLERAQQLLVTIKRGFILAIIVTVVALVGAVLLARRRMRAVVVLLLSSAAVFVIARALVNKILDDAPSIARTPAGRTALDVTMRELAEGLLGALAVLALLFLVGASIAYLLDPNSALRQRVAVRAGSPSLQAAIASNRLVVAFVSIGAALLVITLAGFHVATVIVALLFAALGMYALWLPDAPGADRPGPQSPEPAPAD